MPLRSGVRLRRCFKKMQIRLWIIKATMKMSDPNCREWFWYSRLDPKMYFTRRYFSSQIQYKTCIKCKRFIFFYIIHCLISSKDLACRAAGSSHNENCLLKNIKMNYLTKRHIIVDKMLLEWMWDLENRPWTSRPVQRQPPLPGISKNQSITPKSNRREGRRCKQPAD